MADNLEEFTVTAYKTDPLQQFMRQDFLKSSQFMLLMPLTPVTDAEEARNFSLFCESVEFPGKTVQTTDYKIPGYDRLKIPYSREYPDVTMTFIHNHQTPVYEILSSWMDYASGINTGTDNRYYDEVVSDITLIQFSESFDLNKKFGGLSNILNSIDKLNRKFLDSTKLFNITDIGQTFANRVNDVTDSSSLKRKKYYDIKFRNAYPISVSNIPSNWGDEGFFRVSATFTYEKFTINDNSVAPQDNPPQTSPTAEEIGDILRNTLFG